MLFVLLFDTSPSLTYSERFSAAGQITAEYFAFFFFSFWISNAVESSAERGSLFQEPFLFGFLGTLGSMSFNIFVWLIILVLLTTMWRRQNSCFKSKFVFNVNKKIHSVKLQRRIFFLSLFERYSTLWNSSQENWKILKKPKKEVITGKMKCALIIHEDRQLEKAEVTVDRRIQLQKSKFLILFFISLIVCQPWAEVLFD